MQNSRRQPKEMKLNTTILRMVKVAKRAADRKQNTKQKITTK